MTDRSTHLFRSMKALQVIGGTLALSSLSLGFLPAANAGVLKTTHAKQMSVSRGANSMQGTALGGSYTLSGAGLTGVGIPAILATGQVNIPNTSTTAAVDATHSYSASIGQADIANTGTTFEAAYGAGSYGDMTTKYSDRVAAGGAGVAVGTIAISAAGLASGAAGAGTGSTVTGILSTNLTGLGASVENRRVASSANTQDIVDSDRQETKATMSGSNLAAVTEFGFGQAAVTGTIGTALTADVMAGGGATGPTANGLANGFTAAASITPGQSTLSFAGGRLSAVDVTRPAYGNVTEQVGGSTAGALTFTNFNTVTAIGGGAGTTSSLSFVQEMTAFN